MKLVYIQWYDHSSSVRQGWASLDQMVEESEPLICESVGWLIKDAKDVKTIVSHRYLAKEGFQQKGTGDMTIIAKAVKKMVVLREQ